MAKAEVELEQLPPTREDRNGGTFVEESLPVGCRDSAHPLLTPEVQEVLDGMLPLVFRGVNEAGGVGQRVEVYGTPAYDEIEAHLVVSVWTELPAEEAFSLWDRLGDAIQDWTASLPKSQENIAIDIAIEVLWSVDSAAL
jgi:hypothetical protein